jgi:hypothetical protein
MMLLEGQNDLKPNEEQSEWTRRLLVRLGIVPRTWLPRRSSGHRRRRSQTLLNRGYKGLMGLFRDV